MNPDTAKQPITLRDMGSFHIGGRVVEITGKPMREILFSAGGVPAEIDPNGQYQIEAMYVQYFLPQHRLGKYPLMMWHGGGLTGVTYETTPDGREGWLTMFIRNGWDVYISDAVERGRSGFAPPEIWPDPPLHLTKANPFERFRIGPRAGWNSDPAKREPYPGNQFPVEAYDNFTKQFAPRWTGTDDAVIAAYIALVDKVGPSILMFHSQAGAFGFKVAEARPDLVKALIAIEPAVAGDAALAGRLKDIPTLMVYGDYIACDSRWPHMHRLGLAYAGSLRAAGGIVDVVNLPEAGIKGNSHMLMMDRNNAEIAGLIQRWLANKGLAGSNPPVR